MDLPDNSGHLEVELLSLSAKQFPLEVTLRPRVVELFGDEDGTGEGAAFLGRDVLLQRLRHWSDLADCPLDTVLAQGQLCGDATPPSPAQAALLRWVGAAHVRWEQDYPLDDELTVQLRRLKPVTAALAVTDPLFLVPGRHPVHRLLDSVQAAAIGWQASLGRAGGGMMAELESAVERILGWFDHPAVDFGAILTELENSLARDGERAQKMARRVIDRVLGQQKKTGAAQVAARMINAALARYPVPERVGELLRGAWYHSAQLVVLKFGADSEQWAQMTRTTETLLDSVQVFEAEPEGRRQQLFRAVTLLPKEMRRWLLSLQHDSDAVEEAVGAVEFAHLCILRQNPLETVRVEPLPEGTTREEQATSEADGIEVGQWYLIRRQGMDPLRARIIFRLQPERQLLFANRAGLEALRLDSDEFTVLLAGGDAIRLQRGASFSRSLAAVAEVTEDSDLEQLPRAEAPLLEPSVISTPPSGVESELSAEEEEQARLWREWEEARARQLPGSRAGGGETRGGEKG